MRDAEAPKPNTAEELAELARALTDRPHNYGTCVYAMSVLAVAAFNFSARKCGVTGFQASCADMDFLNRTRGFKHGFIIFNAEDLLYPQYDLPGKLREWISKQTWLKDAAAEKLAEPCSYASAEVVAHWKRLAGVEVEK